MKTIIIHCFAQRLRSDPNKTNPKNYPHWEELIELLQAKNFHVIQVGLPDEKRLVEDFRTVTLKELENLVKECHTWIAIDSFFQHLAWKVKKPGIVLFGPSRPEIFGHRENINLYGGKKYFRPDQFGTWEECEFNPKAFVRPKVVMEYVK
jgi:ADP-heptose:LPS heptosyltransferase